MKINITKVSIGICCTALLMLSSIAFAAETRVQPSLISDTEIAVAGSTIRVGVLYTIPERAHIYWKNPGDAGLATGIEWATDLAIGKLQWPTPQQFAIEGLNEAYFGYTNQVLLFTNVTVPKDAAPDAKLTIRARTYWLLCLDDGVCIPEEQELEITIPVGAESRKAYESPIFDRFAEVVPRWNAVPCQIEWMDSEFTVILPQTFGSFTEVALRPARYFPFQGGGWTAAEITASSVTFRPDYKGDKPGPGVLVLPTIDTNNGIPTTYYLTTSGPK